MSTIEVDADALELARKRLETYRAALERIRDGAIGCARSCVANAAGKILHIAHCPRGIAAEALKEPT